MPINNITQIISTIPEAGRRGVDVQTVFVNKQEDFQDHLQGTTVTELNNLKTQMNTMSGEMNTTASQVNTNANTASTKASEASASATSASTSASTATTQASQASTSASTATTQAGISTTKANEASASASTATTQAGISTTKANEASASATSASTSAGQALTSRNQAETFAQQAQASAASVDANNIVHKNEVLGSFGRLSSPLLDLPLKNSLTMKAGVGSTTFTRASTATYIDRYGVLKTANIDVPRFEKEGYLNEGSSTNLILNSETLTNQSVAVISGITYTISFYGTGVVTLGGAFSSSINGLGLFPTRTKLTFVATSTILTISVSGEAKLAQLEALSFATSYIPTTSSQVTRSADVLQVTRENNFPNAENNAQGYSIAFTVNPLGFVSGNNGVWSLYSNSSNWVVSAFASTNSLRNSVRLAGAVVQNISSTPTNKPFNAVQYQSNGVLKQYIDGILSDTDTNTNGLISSSANSLTNITIGGFSGITTSNMYGHISNFKVYDRELTPVEVTLL